MNFERLRWGEWIAAIAALDLLLVTFRAWYKVSGGGGRVTAWDALDNGRYLLIATAIVGMFLLLIRAAEDTQQLSFPPGWLAAAVGLACTGYVAYRLATPPSDALDADSGLYLGLVSAAGVAIGGLLSAREGAAPVTRTTAAEAAPDTFGAPAAEEPFASPAPAQTWSPAAPAPSTSGWSPAAPAPSAAVPPATAAGADAAAAGQRELAPGDEVRLTTGSARFPAGTIARVAEVFGGGALVEVTAPDGLAERFEAPDSAFERIGATGAAAGATPGESWSPAMPAPAGEDWSFEEPAANGAPVAAEEPAPAKAPWWKREIGGGKKKDKGAHGAEAAAAGAAAGAAIGAAEQKPGLFKRLFGGGGRKAEAEAESVEPEGAGETWVTEPERETTPAADVAGLGPAAESDTAISERQLESAVDEPPAAASAEPAAVPEPEAAAPPAPEPEPVIEPEPAAAEPEPPAAAATPPEPEPVIEPEPAAAEPEPPAAAATAEPEPEPPAAAAAPEATSEPPASEPTAPGPEPEPAASAPASPTEPPAASDSEAAGPGAAAAASAGAGADEETPPKPKRRRSSASRKVPQEALAGSPAEPAPPKVGDTVELKVGGGRYSAGTRGRVVDVFSAGVIVELEDPDGRTERLDLPFEAIGPAE